MQEVKGILGYLSGKYPVDFVVSDTVIVAYHKGTFRYIGSWRNNSKGKADCTGHVLNLLKNPETPSQ